MEVREVKRCKRYAGNLLGDFRPQPWRNPASPNPLMGRLAGSAEAGTEFRLGTEMLNYGFECIAHRLHM